MKQSKKFREKILYNGLYYPTTRLVGFIKGNIDELVDKLINPDKDFVGGPLKGYACKTISGTLDQGLEQFWPVMGPFNRQYLYTETASPWIAVFTDNGEMNVAMNVTSKSLLLGYTPNTCDSEQCGGTLGVSYFSILDPIRMESGLIGADTTRHISVSNGLGGWTMEQYGPPLDFEDVERYSSRIKKKRLPYELLLEYCSHFGIRPFDESFYGSEMRYIRKQSDYELLKPFDRQTDEIQYMNDNQVLTYNAYHKRFKIKFGRWQPD